MTKTTFADDDDDRPRVSDKLQRAADELIELVEELRASYEKRDEEAHLAHVRDCSICQRDGKESGD